MTYVKSVEHIKDYKLKITFGDGLQKEVDLESCLDGKIFQPLKDIHYFKKVKVNSDIDTICWDNGADLAPEFLYTIGKNI